MFILDYDYVIGMGGVEYNIFLKLLKGEEDMTDSDEERIEQMLRTAVKVKKIRASRNRMDRQRQRPAGIRVSPRRPVANDIVDGDRDAKEATSESGFGVASTS